MTVLVKNMIKKQYHENLTGFFVKYLYTKLIHAQTVTFKSY